MHILLTNDDSHRSPLLRCIIDILSKIGDLSIVVPRDEQSWRGKSLTRFGPVHYEKISLFGREAYAVAGTPADCVNIGLAHLVKKPVDLVVSGVNAGMNAGSSFIFSSGTVGACFEANIASVPAVAFSQQFSHGWWQGYIEEYKLKDEVLTHIEKQLHVVIPRFFKKIECDPTYLNSDHPVTLNLNIPENLNAEWSFKPALLAPVTYTGFFAFDGIHFENSGVFNTKRIEINERQDQLGYDADILAGGDVPVSSLDIHSFGAVSAIEQEKISALLK